MRSKLFTTLLILLIGFIVLPIISFTASASDDKQRANNIITQNIQSVDKGEMEADSEQFQSFRTTWLSIEDELKNNHSRLTMILKITWGKYHLPLFNNQ
ncbi:hypothetical protein [Peribacillus simplex]|uniref:hypothetical protein n=1 Tax=Peribacillus simplex TaxID=1478 RepID=UPI00333937D6